MTLKSMPMPDLYDDSEVETIAKAFNIIRKISDTIDVYDSLLRTRSSEGRIYENKRKLSERLSDYDDLVNAYKLLPERAKDCQLLRDAKSELDKKIHEVTTKYDLVSAVVKNESPVVQGNLVPAVSA